MGEATWQRRIVRRGGRIVCKDRADRLKKQTEPRVAHHEKWIVHRLLMMVSSPFASPRVVRNFGPFYLNCVKKLPLL
jgi:hypothetical protein